MLLQPRVWHHRIIADHPLDRRDQAGQAVLGEIGGNLGAVAGGERRLVDDHAASGLLHRGPHRVTVVWLQGSKIDQLGRYALFRQPLRRFLRIFPPLYFCLAVMIGMNLQTSFLTPPFGFALFYLRGVAPPSVTTMDIYRGVIPFVVIQILGLALIALFPAMATWLPKMLF